MVKHIRLLMIRLFSWPQIMSLTLTLLPAIVPGATVSAQAWTPFQFHSGGSYEYHVQRFEHSPWDDTPTLSSEFFYTIAVRPTGNVSPDGERIFEVTTANRRRLTESRLGETFSFGRFAFDDFLMFGGPFEFAVILNALAEMEFEVGERMSIFGMGRVSIAAKETIAGRTGLLVRHEVGEASERRVALELVIDRRLSLPLAVRQYDELGRLILHTTLVKYEEL